MAGTLAARRKEEAYKASRYELLYTRYFGYYVEGDFSSTKDFYRFG
jgi:hypothetical protein